MFLEKPVHQIFPITSTSDDNLEYTHKITKTMATDFAMPVQQFAASPTQYSLYNSQQTSPINSATATPNNTSPTSPRSGVPAHLAAHTRQLRPPKSPLYVPAVLRPTDPPKRTARQSPLTPPHSKSNSFDDSDPLRTLSRRSTGDSGKFGLGAIVEAEWSSEGLNGFEKVKGLPTRDHWKPDSESVVCDDTTCQVYFGFLSRKHHCRRCGNIFCDRHSKHAIPLTRTRITTPRAPKFVLVSIAMEIT
ncbi:hypothetical protein VTL71DRAFT_8133 [Oculimacula yallundae]|uniref:FYVE zinc finger domain-containing protein n=1 Tax=Oculimacula yallundae TaxID=86028 RepID=A0ABR4CWU1_9HELO